MSEANTDRPLIGHAGLTACWVQLREFELNTGEMLDRCADDQSVVVARAMLCLLDEAWKRSECTDIAAPRVDMDPDGIISLAWDGDCYFAFACYPDQYVWYSVRAPQEGDDPRTLVEYVPFENGSPEPRANRAIFTALKDNCPKVKEPR